MIKFAEAIRVKFINLCGKYMNLSVLVSLRTIYDYMHTQI